ncbi:MAG: 3-deoxy-D-manno-octulosonic acid transferase [Acidobacteriota bacterium]|nr:3-deoxy-D-manno-octulosonic acid transferase [Acidobacteriota bacterium]
MYLLYSTLLSLALLFSLPYWVFQMLRHGKYHEGLSERLGKIPTRNSSQLFRPAIWIHAVSVGEVLAISGVVERLRLEFPQHRVVISTTTDSSQRLARKRFGKENVFYFPFDFAFAIRPYLRLLRPVLVVIAETEFWPNFLRLSHESGARLAIVNARISDRSLPGYRRFSRIFKRILNQVDLFLTQTSGDARRLNAIGAPGDRVHVSGNLKFDVPLPPATPIVANLRSSLGQVGAGPVFVCGSTAQDEEPLLLRAFQNVLASYPKAVMILAPRHPERFAEVGKLLHNLHMPFWRRSTWNGDPIIGGVLLLDTIGELTSLYGLADVAFVGGSLVPHGGHNIIEPAQHGIAIVVGNHTENFRDIVELFASREAVKIVGPAELPLVFMELIANDSNGENSERMALGRRAAQTVREQMGATERTMSELRKLLPTNERSHSLNAESPAHTG